MTSNDPRYVACPECGSMGYTDERQYSKDLEGYLCARCAKPDYQWILVNN